MKLLAGWLLGLGTAWAALAIWRTVPPLGPIDPADEWEPRRGDRRPGFRDSVATPDFSPIEHDAACEYPRRPCVCAVFVPMHGGFGSP